MKKISRMLAVFALCLALIALPTQAMAESMNMLALTISDPVITANGETFLDMTGLSVDLTAGMTDDMNKGTVQLQVSGGSETALAALAEFADGKLVLTADGLNEKYSVSLETLQQMAGSEEFSAGFELGQELAAAVQELFNGSLMNDLSAPFEDFSTQMMMGMKDEGTVNYKMLSGEIEMQHMSAQVTPEMADKLATDIMAVLDSNPEFQNIMAIVANASGEPEAANMSLLEAYNSLGMSQKIDMDLYSSADGSSIAVEMVQAISTATNDAVNELHYRVLVEQGMDGMKVYADVDIYVDSEAQAGAYLAFQQKGTEEFTLEAGSGEYDGDEYESEFTLKASVAPTMIGAVAATETKVEIEADGATMTFTCSGYEDQGKLYGQMNMEVDGVVLGAVFDGETTMDGLNGNIELSAQTDYGESYAVQAKVSMGPVMADASDVIVGADGAIDISTLQEEDMEGVMNSVSALMINAVSVLDRNVPGLSGILTQMIGSMSY